VAVSKACPAEGWHGLGHRAAVHDMRRKEVDGAPWLGITVTSAGVIES
jgi:hypothetical protein